MPNRPDRHWARVLLWSTAILVALLPFRAVAAQIESLHGLDEFIEIGMEEWQIPGLAVAVVRHDSVLFLDGYGVRTVGTDDPVDGQTLFAVASCTKAFTATALGILVSEGVVGWDDPVNGYLPGFQLYDPWVTRHLTIRDLLSHRTGYAGWAADHLWQGSELDADEILRRFRYQEPAGGFRARYGYSNIMYLAAGEIIPAVTGESWHSFVTERLLEPLGMYQSTLSVDGLGERDNVATPHIEIHGEPEPVAWYDLDNVAPAMALNSNASDMAAWLRLHLAHGVFDGDTLVSPRIIEDMQTPQIWYQDPMDAIELEDRSFNAYGLGWDLFDYHGRKAVRHSGSVDGMGSLITMIPGSNLGVVVLTNMIPGQFPLALSNHIIDAVLGDAGPDWNAKLLQQRADSRKKEKQERWYWDKARDKRAKRSLPLDQYLGEYFDSLSGAATVTEEDGGLVFRYNDKYIGDLTHWQHDIYRVAWRDPYVRLWAGRFLIFIPNGKGAIGMLRVAFDNEIQFTKRHER
ncbi:MAG: serine hydrolase [Gemmatimonadetes bacterium]|nr:serine hydrolase [Gemmatimonadota bacterium]